MACLAGMCLCCCAEGEWRCFTFSSCALTTSVTLIGRALRGVSLLIGPSVLRCWMVTLDIDDFVNVPMPYDIFFTNSRLPCDMRYRLFIEAHPDGLTEQTEWPPPTIKEGDRAVGVVTV